MGNSIYYSINILLGSFQLFLRDQPLSEGEIIRSAVSASRGGCIIHAGGGGGYALTDRLLMYGDATTSGNIITQSIISALASIAPSVYFASSAATSRWRICMSVIAAFASPSSLAFLSLGTVGNGVITVTINSPWQADDDADNQSGDNRGDSAHTSISLTVPPLLWILQSGCQPYARTDHNQRPAVKPRYCCNGRLPDRDITDQSWVNAMRSLICCNTTASWLFGEKSFRPSCLR